MNTNLMQAVPSATQAAHMYDGPEGDNRLLLDLHSPIIFKAYERPLYYKGRDGDEYANTQHKALVRVIDDKPVCLNVVRNTYKVVQNDELFNAIHDGLAQSLTRDEMSRATIHDKLSYNGSVCFREYRFHSIAFQSPERHKIAFRIIIQNGFGTGAIKLYAGAIDFFCTNGLVTGDYTKKYTKHTKGLQLSSFTEAVNQSVQVFWKNKEFFATLSSKRVLDDNAVRTWLVDKFSDRLGLRLYNQYLREASNRGKTLWAVLSALTHYASHHDGDFALRNTGSDHHASTMMKREETVRRVIEHDRNEFMKLAA